MADPLDDILGPRTASFAAPKIAGSDPLEDILGPRKAPEEQYSYGGGIGRALLRGATMEGVDEIEGGLSALAGGSYDDTVKKRRAMDKNFDAANPWTSAGARGVGALASFLPIGWAARGTGMLARGLAGLGEVTGMANMARSAQTAGQIAQGGQTINALATPLRQGAVGAVKYGAATRALDSPGKGNDRSTLDGAVGRVTSALDPGSAAVDAATGVAGTAVGNFVGHRLGSMYDTARQALREGGDPSVGSYREAARAMQRAGIQGTDELRAVMFPDMQPGRKPITPERLQDVVASVYEARAAGARNPIREVSDAIFRDPALRAQHGNVSQKTLRQHVQRIVQAYDQHNAMPVTITEAAAMARGPNAEAKPVERLYRATANMDGLDETQGAVLDWAAGRQAAQPAAMQEIIQANAGSGDTVAARQAAAQFAKDANAIYKPAMDWEQHALAQRPKLQKVDEAALNSQLMTMEQSASPAAQQSIKGRVALNPNEVRAALGESAPTPVEELKNRIAVEIEKARAAAGGRDGPVAKGINDAADLFDKEGVGQLQKFQDLKRELDQLIAAETDVAGKVTPLGRELTQMRQGVTKAAHDINPVYRLADQRRAQAYKIAEALETGNKNWLNASADRQQFLADFRKMSADEKAMVRETLSQRLQANVLNPTQMANTGRIFNRPAVQQLLVEVLGPDEARALTAAARRANLATRTYQATKNSHTAELIDHKKKMAWMQRIYQAMQNPLAAVGMMGEHLADQATRQKNDQILRLLASNTDNPRELIDQLRRLQASMDYVNNPASALPSAVRPVANYSPLVANVAGNAHMDESNRR